jgi:hypothetical protein
MRNALSAGVLSPVRERERKREMHVHATLSPSFSPLSLYPLSLTSEQGAHTLFTVQREREKEGGRESELLLLL